MERDGTAPPCCAQACWPREKAGRQPGPAGTQHREGTGQLPAGLWDSHVHPISGTVSEQSVGDKDTGIILLSHLSAPLPCHPAFLHTCHQGGTGSGKEDSSLWFLTSEQEAANSPPRAVDTTCPGRASVSLSHHTLGNSSITSNPLLSQTRYLKVREESVLVQPHAAEGQCCTSNPKFRDSLPSSPVAQTLQDSLA